MPNLHFDKPMALHLFTVNVVVSAALKMCFVCGSSPSCPHVASVEADASDYAGLPPSVHPRISAPVVCSSCIVRLAPFGSVLLFACSVSPFKLPLAHKARKVVLRQG